MTLTRSRWVSELSPEVRYYVEDYVPAEHVAAPDRDPLRQFRRLVLPDCEPAYRTPEPRSFPGAVFDPARVDRVLAAMLKLRHTQGKWAGRPLAPDVWQIAYLLAPVFGWVAPNAEGRLVRIIREVFLDVPRKNGKTTIASGLGLILAFADGEPGAQVLAVAGSKDQAQNAYRPARTVAEKSPDLRRAGVKPFRDQIIRPSDGSFLRVAASVGDLLHGANIHGAIVDELHVHKSPDVLDAVESGTASREQPLVIIITTADDGRTETVYGQKRRYIEDLAKGVVKNPRAYGVVFAADAADDPFSEATWKRANPGYGVSVSAEFMRGEADKARSSPVNRARFERLHLGVRSKAATRYISLEVWDRNASIVLADKLAGRECFGGLDLASVSDIAALTYLFPDGGGGYDVMFRAWVPEAALPDLDKRTANAASGWVRSGHLTTTPGDVTDYDYIKAQILSDADTFDIRGIGYDPWNASQLQIDLAHAGVEMVKVRQGFATLSTPLKEVLRLLMIGHEDRPVLRHGGNPLARWAINNLAVQTDAAGNVKPDKAHSGDKIDPVAALVTAMSEAMAAQAKRRSAYSGGNTIRAV